MRCPSIGALALCLLLTACGPGDPPEAVPIDGVGGSGGGGSPGGSVGGVAILSHNAGQDCMSCHKAGGSGASKGIFTVAGTAYRSDGSPQIHATVLVYPQGSDTAQATMTVDGLGNFWTAQPVAALVPAAGQQFAQGAHPVVRPTAGTARSMLGVITNGSCNSCHSTSGGVARVTAQQADSQHASIASSGGNGESPAAEPTSSIPLARIATGAAHSCVVKSDGGVMCWGSNSQHQLGNNGGDQATPVAVSALGQVSASAEDHSIAAGDNHTCIIAANGNTVLCWGANDKGQLGNGNTEPAPLSAVALAGVNALSASGDETCARVGSGEEASFYCWGTTPRRVDAGAGDLPNGLLPLLDSRSMVSSIAARSVAGLESTSFSQIATGPNYSCGITAGNRIKCWEGSHASVDVPVE
jgi:hypothetical protein